MEEMDVKASFSPTEIPLNAANAVPDVLAQERVTGDVLRGYGPRRGNLEKLLRYWRPIMRREGGFTRCRVILADHPELYPLEPLCAWLHHETTGMWPNEGCHHPGMKNCRTKLKKIVNGSVWNDSEWNDRLEGIQAGRIQLHRSPGKLPNVPGKGYYEDDEPKGHSSYGPIGMGNVPSLSNYSPDQGRRPNYETHLEELAAEQMDDDDLLKSCIWGLKGFMSDEPEWVEHLRDDKNWEHVGDDDEGYVVAIPHPGWKPAGGSDGGCGCGGSCGGSGGCGGHGSCGCGGSCGGMKTLLDDLDIEMKVGKPLSSRSIKRIKDAIEALQYLLDETGNGLQQKEDIPEDLIIEVDAEYLFDIKSLIDPILEYHNIETEIYEDGILMKDIYPFEDEVLEAIDNVLDAFENESE